MAYFFSSDHHFGHRNIIRYCDRPFNSVPHMNDCLIRNWNETVGKDDIIYYLGDFGFGSHQYLKEIMDNLNGNKVFIRGNHDKQLPVPRSQQHDLFDLKIRPEDDNVVHLVLSHYPIESWNGKFHGSIHLHGHCHGRLQNILTNRIDVGIDNVAKLLWGRDNSECMKCPIDLYRPISYDEIVDIITNRVLDKGM